ncbi:TetR/AcrR family transcriptional regulator [Gordonia sp. NPDC003376]
MTSSKRPTHKERLLESGLRLLYADGYHGTTVDAVLAASEAPKGSFYHHFGSKEAFGFAVLDAYDRIQHEIIGQWAARTDLTVPQRIAGFHEVLVERLVASNWQASCLIGKLSNELAATSETYRKRLAHSYTDWRDVTIAMLDTGRSDGEIRTDVTTEHLADTVLAMVDGSFVAALVLRDRDYLDATTRGLQVLLSPGPHAPSHNWQPKRRRRSGRSDQSPKDGDARTAHREQLLRTGIDELFDRGYHGTTVDRILDRAHVPKGSFYHHFGSKESFVVAVLDAYGDFHRARLSAWSARLDESTTADVLFGYYTEMAQIFVDSGFRNTDLAGKLATEVATSSDVLRHKVAELVGNWRRQLEEILAHGQERGEVRTDADVGELSAAVHALIDGSFVVAASTRDNASLSSVADAVVDVITGD